jgi:hypothetical protein
LINDYVYGVAEHWVNMSFILFMIKYIIPSDNADMSNDKGIAPRLKLMVLRLLSASKFIIPKGLNDEILTIYTIR